MGDVTAVNMDVVTDKSGHVFAPCAVSVCITPAAPSPIPVPYPVVGNTSDGATAPALRTSFNGAKIITVGSVFTACHGNEAGTMKEVVSLNTAGPCFPLAGAPTVLVELGMQAITGSPGIMNKGITAGASGSTSGANGGAGNASGAGDGGGGGGGAKPKGPSSGGGSSKGGAGSGASGPTAEEKKLAAQPNANPDDGKNADRVAARKKVAQDFYEKNGQKYDRNLGAVRPMQPKEIDSEMQCTDFNKPVVTGPPPPCQSPMGQWQAPGNNRGNYFAEPGTPPGDLGIGDKGVNWKEPSPRQVYDKECNAYNISPTTPYMTSTASPANDTWSLENGKSQPAMGGGQQTYIPAGCDSSNQTDVQQTSWIKPAS